jgi:hypothetical protein
MVRAYVVGCGKRTWKKNRYGATYVPLSGWLCMAMFLNFLFYDKLYHTGNKERMTKE